MNTIEAYARFEQWTDRSDLPITSQGCRPTRDTWSMVAVAVVQIMDRLESATTDDDLRAALREWVALREQDPLYDSALDWQLRTVAEQVMLAIIFPKVPGRCRVTRNVSGPSVRHQIHMHRRIIEVTPTLARSILDLNAETRGVELECPDGCIVEFMAKIRSGTWTAIDPNPNTTPRIVASMREDAGGRLIGGLEFETGLGAHRLQSIVNAGVTVEMEFVAPLAAFERVEQLAAAEMVTV
jgi:hypothetical protein